MNDSEYIRSYNGKYKFLEEIPPKHYEIINSTINDLFKQKESFALITSSFYNYPINNSPIPQRTQDILKKILTPNNEFSSEIDEIKKSILGELNSYVVLHIRSGDSYICNNVLNKDLYKKTKAIISKTTSANSCSNILLICDSQAMGQQVKKDFPEIYYWDSKKIHLGKRDEISDKKARKKAIKDTLIDFFLLIGAQKIIGFGSGFSHIVSRIFDIPYDLI
jgi:hypothetical protein